MTDSVSPRRRRETIEALRRGTVPSAGLDLLAVGLDRFAPALDRELDAASSGAAVFKAIRGEYGAGKTFLVRWLAERALRRGFAAAEIQISETETPLHRLETVYRRLTESVRTSSFPPSALQPVFDSWLYTLERDAASHEGAQILGRDSLAAAVGDLLERRLATVSAKTPMFAQGLRAFHAACEAGDFATSAGLAAWLGGQPNVGATIKRRAGIRGELDHFGSLGFLQGLLAVLRDSGHAGLLVVLDEVETLQRVRSDARDKALNALRQLIDEVHSGRFPGLFLVITGTPAFYDGPQGVQRLAPLAQRLATDFTANPKFDNPRAVQLRLTGFTEASLVELGGRVRGLYAAGISGSAAGRIEELVDDAYLVELAGAVAGRLGGKVGVAPRLFLKKLVGDVLDRVDQFDDFDPRRDYPLTIASAEMSELERNAAAKSADDVELDLG